jgi:hypothetical protein
MLFHASTQYDLQYTITPIVFNVYAIRIVMQRFEFKIYIVTWIEMPRLRLTFPVHFATLRSRHPFARSFVLKLT